MRRAITQHLLPVAAIAAVGGTWLGHYAWPGTNASACTAGSFPMHRVELVFGMSRKDQREISEAGWRKFLDAEITPRLPDGLTVLEGQGQWRNSAGEIVKEPSRLLLVWVKPQSDLAQRIEAIRSAWKQAQGQESVLKAVSRDCVSF